MHLEADFEGRPFVPVKPDALLKRLMAGAVANVSFADARKLLDALRFDELRVKGSHQVYGHPVSSSIFRTAAVKPSPTSYGKSFFLSVATIRALRRTNDGRRVPHGRVLERRGRRLGS
jgi:predicted RNA binding protein YcfA (HicA-like mRNA interferase family)